MQVIVDDVASVISSAAVTLERYGKLNIKSLYDIIGNVLRVAAKADR